IVHGEVVRKFGTYSGNKEIEAIAVDNELGYVYYSDETAGVRKYYANPNQGNEELAFFGQEDALRDHEGIAIYKKEGDAGYILVSDQQNNSFLVYDRAGTDGNPHMHTLLAEIPVSAIECDGADAVNMNLGPKFPEGMLVAMSNGRVFHYYDWRIVQQWIDEHPIKK
ncbi:phytase, partial [Brucella sp. 21LCYQ03]|nr:phytase [Brucella sp. 21LCYQ03]